MSKSKPESPSCKKGDADKPGETVKECPRGQLVVNVKDSDGKPVKDVDVNAGIWGAKKTDKDGIADFGKVPAGTDKVIAKKAAHAPKRYDPLGEDSKSGVVVTDGSKTTVDLVQHPSCANVAFFEGATSKSEYYGFDHKTNLVVTPGTGEYWLPTPARGSLTMPTNRETRDAARWVSVAKDKTSEVEINFAFTGGDCIPCLANTTFEVTPANIADVETTSVSAKKAAFTIKGKAEGEASLKVICDGRDIGWFHIWCKTQVTIKVDVVNLITTKASASAFDLASMEADFNEIYKPSAIKVEMIDLGSVDMSAVATFASIENRGYPAGTTKFLETTGGADISSILGDMHTAADAILAARTTGTLPRAGAYRLYRYIPTVGAQWAGWAVSIGTSPAFGFMSDSAAGRNSLAHEFGHCLGLRHPSDGSSGSQFATHNRSTLNQAVPAYPATNTEPASAAGSAASNVMKNDPTNLMGYWSDKANRKPIRYHQWKATNRS
ncbi:MAG: hypothetical protein NTW21_03305 [Verrucomicrobia bacterium]|nr:hypothetical protein [Verrucomicrobiota bacterium]